MWSNVITMWSKRMKLAQISQKSLEKIYKKEIKINNICFKMLKISSAIWDVFFVLSFKKWTGNTFSNIATVKEKNQMEH